MSRLRSESLLSQRALLVLRPLRCGLGVRQEQVFQSGDHGKTAIGKASDILADQAYSFSGLVGLRQGDIVLIGDAKIVPDDVALLNIKRHVRQRFFWKDGERVDPERRIFLAAAADILKGVTDHLLTGTVKLRSRARSGPLDNGAGAHRVANILGSDRP